MKKRRVDWEKEEERSARARIRGLRYTFVSFLAVLGVAGVLKLRYPGLNLFPSLSVMVALLAGAAILILLTRRK